jgi:hypothetical protein
MQDDRPLQLTTAKVPAHADEARSLLSIHITLMLRWMSALNLGNNLDRHVEWAGRVNCVCHSSICAYVRPYIHTGKQS